MKRRLAAGIAALLIVSGCSNPTPVTWDTSGPDYVDAFRCDKAGRHVIDGQEVWKCEYNGQDADEYVGITEAESPEVARLAAKMTEQDGGHADSEGRIVASCKEIAVLVHAMATYRKNKP